MNAILTLIFLAILLLCAWFGYKRGLIMGVGALLVLIISIYGANLLSTTYSYEIIDALRPFVSGFTETTVNSRVRQEFNIPGSEAASLSVDDYLEQNPEQAEEFCRRTYVYLGFYESTARQMAAEAVEYANTQDTGYTGAITEIFCQRVVYVAGFVLIFLIMLIILTVIGNLPNLSFKIPGLDLLNDIGGAVTGLLQGIFFCVLIAWALKFTGLLLAQDKVAESGLVAWFMRWDPLHKFLGI